MANLRREVAQKMVDSLLNAADQCDVDLSGVNRTNFNSELDERFRDGGEARCEQFADLGWEYAARFGKIGEDAFDKAQHEVLQDALGLLEKRLNEENKMVEHIVQIKVKAPKKLTPKKVAALVNKLLDVGYAEAMDSQDCDDYDHDADLVEKLEIASPVVVN